MAFETRNANEGMHEKRMKRDEKKTREKGAMTREETHGLSDSSLYTSHSCWYACRLSELIGEGLLDSEDLEYCGSGVYQSGPKSMRRKGAIGNKGNGATSSCVGG